MSDLISREALRNVILNDRKLDGANANWEVNRILVHIDKATTVPLPDFKEGYKQAIIDGKTIFSRPQGKWIFHKDFNESCRYGCNQCGNLNNIPSNFCPNCGAKMVKK